MSDESDRESQVSDMDMGPELVPTEPRLEHFKVEFDPSWDYEAIARSLFLPDKKILVVGENFTKNKHVHFQGYTDLAERTFNNKRQKLAEKHCTRDKTNIMYRPNARPISAAKRAVTEVGFQYMCKEPPSAHNPIFSILFTPEELAELHAASKDLVEKKKFKTIDFIHENMEPERVAKALDKESCNHVWTKALQRVAKEMRANNKLISQHTRRDIVNGLFSHPSCPDYFQCWLLNGKF